VYYGAAGETLCAAEFDVSQILASLESL
jgi:hypothetical protein